MPYPVDELVRGSQQFRRRSRPVSPNPDCPSVLQLLPRYFRGQNGKIYRQSLVLSSEYLTRDAVSTERYSSRARFFDKPPPAASYLTTLANSFTAHRAKVLPVPSLFKQDLHLMSGNTSAWFNEIRCEFILSFFDLVDCWRQLRCNPLALAELEPTNNRNVSRFCALLHFCFLAWDTGLDVGAQHGQLTTLNLRTTGGLSPAEVAYRGAEADGIFGGAKQFAETLLWEQADPLAELCLKWIHHYWNGFDPTERSELLQRYTDAFQRMHNFVRLPSSFLFEP